MPKISLNIPEETFSRLTAIAVAEGIDPLTVIARGCALYEWWRLQEEDGRSITVGGFKVKIVWGEGVAKIRLLR